MSEATNGKGIVIGKLRMNPKLIAGLRAAGDGLTLADKNAKPHADRNRIYLKQIRRLERRAQRGRSFGGDMLAIAAVAVAAATDLGERTKAGPLLQRLRQFDPKIKLTDLPDNHLQRSEIERYTRPGVTLPPQDDRAQFRRLPKLLQRLIKRRDRKIAGEAVRAVRSKKAKRR